VLAGLLTAYLNLDEVIEIIRSADEPKTELMRRFKLSEIQANAILDIRLRQLAKLEEIKIKNEQAELDAEKEYIEGILGSRSKLKTLIRNELKVDAEQFGDERRSPLAEREAAQALDETALVSAEPVTIVLSEKGWVRAAKGHDVDAAALTYKSGDHFLAAALGRSTQAAMFIDSSGRCYALPAHTLPSARGQGEPLTGRLTPPDGAVFRGVMAGGDDACYLLASDAGYGFVARLGELYSKNKKGKTALTVPRGARVLLPAPVTDIKTDRMAAISADGHLLVIPMADVPQMARGKGNKIVGIPSKKFADREDFVAFITVLPAGASLVIHAGQRHVTLKPKDLVNYQGERGKRGRKLPRGLQKVDGISIEA
jgi:topoisomerase-4 subunit A